MRNLRLALVLAILIELTTPGLASAVDMDTGFSATHAWKQVIEKGDLSVIQGSYVVLDKLKDKSGSTVAAQCTAEKALLEKALDDNPVSLALQAAASDCAHALGDEAASDQYSQNFAKLVRVAMSGQSGNFGEIPVRVMAEPDIEAFVHASGELLIHIFYTLEDNATSLKMHVGLWNSESDRERWLSFDYLESQIALQHNNSYAEFPVFRFQIARTSIDTFSKTTGSIAGDMQAVYMALATPETKQRQQALEGLADQGNHAAINHFVYLCLMRHDASCESKAVDLLLPGAESHSAMAMLMLAALKADPTQVSRDEKSATTLLDAADRRLGSANASAQFATVINARSKGGILSRFVRKRLQMAADAGNPNAEWLLASREVTHEKRMGRLRNKTMDGLIHAASTGLPGPEEFLARNLWSAGDKEAARKWFESAANHGDVDAQRWMAAMFESGTETAVDLKSARFWHAKAANQGNIDSMLWLAHYYRDQPQTAQTRHQQSGWLRSATVLGDINASVQLAELFQAGGKGIDAGSAQAESLYRAVLGKHDRADARRGLASLLFGTEGVKQNLDEAHKLLIADAEKGDPLSQTELGIHLANGDFGSIDQSGRSWLKKAADVGNTRAAASLGILLYYNSDGGGRDPTASIAYLGKAAERGYNEARNNLAWVLCTIEEEPMRDPQRGLGVIRYLLEEQKENPVSWLDTHAACQAANGDFDEAVRLEEQAIAALQEINPSNTKAIERFETYAASYRKKQPLIEHVDTK